MKSKTILIAESGSTKTDWCLIHQNKSKKYQTQGINPFFLQSHEIAAILEKELKVKKDIIIDEIHFYGAGISSTDKQKVIERALKSVFQVKKNLLP
jgi:glucosamine kinase